MHQICILSKTCSLLTVLQILIPAPEKTVGMMQTFLYIYLKSVSSMYTYYMSLDNMRQSL